MMENAASDPTISILERFRAAYTTLETEVLQATRLHLGDVRRLDVIRGRVLSFKQAAEQVSSIILLGETNQMIKLTVAF